jgi:hypothetical protein
MKKPRFKKSFNYSRIGIVWRGLIPHLVRLHYVGTVSTFPFGWKIPDRKRKAGKQLNFLDKLEAGKGGAQP